jgi:uncharacterized protein YecT (DUF1311 family)
MMRSRWLLAAISAAFVVTVAAADAALPVVKKSFADRTRIYQVTYEYPQTGHAVIDKEIAEWARGFMHDFETQTKQDHQPQERPYTADLRYKIARNDDQVFAVVFHDAYDQGGAHPNSGIITFNFLMPDGWRVYLPEIVKPGGFGRVSELAIADLDRRLQLASPNDDVVRSGAGPYSFYFPEFTLLKNEIVLHFDPYAVASYADGPQEAHLALSDLTGVMRDDWRAPQPSFDCAKAQSRIEHVLCSDVALARLDRQLSEEYLHRIKVDGDKAYIERTENEQREWLAKRDRDCARATDIKTCLAASYHVRLKVIAPGL